MGHRLQDLHMEVHLLTRRIQEDMPLSVQDNSNCYVDSACPPDCLYINVVKGNKASLPLTAKICIYVYLFMYLIFIILFNYVREWKVIK